MRSKKVVTTSSERISSEFRRVAVRETPMMTPSRFSRSMAASTLSKTPSPRRASVRSFIPSMDRAGLTLPMRPSRFATASSISVPFVYMTKKQSGKRSARSRKERLPSRQARGSPPLITNARVPQVSYASRTVRSKVAQSRRSRWAPELA